MTLALPSLYRPPALWTPAQAGQWMDRKLRDMQRWIRSLMALPVSRGGLPLECGGLPVDDSNGLGCCGSGSGSTGCFGCTPDVWPSTGNIMLTLSGFTPCASGCLVRGTQSINFVSASIDGDYCVPMDGIFATCSFTLLIPVDIRYYTNTTCSGTPYLTDTAVLFTLDYPDSTPLSIQGTGNHSEEHAFRNNLPTDHCLDGETFTDDANHCALGAGIFHGGSVTISYAASC